MRSLSDFYDDLHAQEKSYAGATYYMKSLWSHGALKAWAGRMRGRRVRLLDVGCGKGYFLRDFAAGMQARWELQHARAIGLDLVRSSGDVFSELNPPMEFVQADTDGKPLPLEDGSQDLIACNHVLEHVFHTENMVREFRRVLSPEGLCIIGVPNIAAWVNRVGFLWGNQPLGTEIGIEKTTYGFRPRFLQVKLEPFRPAGHIRSFTPRGLQDLTEHCGFQVDGWWTQSAGIVARLNKWAGRNMAILLRPNK
jgi:SAM-dependent methyltransferase